MGQSSAARGRPMTQEERLEIFGGLNGKMKPILRAFAKEPKLAEGNSDIVAGVWIAWIE
ncbi:hypothetical protein ARSEF1564_008808 [Beauveria bassiana]